MKGVEYRKIIHRVPFLSTDTGELTNYTFIQFYNNPCWTGAGQPFESSLSQWLSFSRRKNVGIMIGIPAHPRASSQTRYHRNVDDLRTLYEVSAISDRPETKTT